MKALAHRRARTRAAGLRRTKNSKPHDQSPYSRRAPVLARHAGDTASMSALSEEGLPSLIAPCGPKTSLRRVGCQRHRRLVVMRWASVVMVAVAAHVVIVIVPLAGWAACEARLRIRAIEAPRALVVRRL